MIERGEKKRLVSPKNWSSPHFSLPSLISLASPLLLNSPVNRFNDFQLAQMTNAREFGCVTACVSNKLCVRAYASSACVGAHACEREHDAATTGCCMDATQNTDMKQSNSCLPWDMRQRGVSQGEWRPLIGQKTNVSLRLDGVCGCVLQQQKASRSLTHTNVPLMCNSGILCAHRWEELPVTDRQTGRAVLGDAVLIVGLPRIPWGRTPGYVRLLLDLLDRKTDKERENHTE